MRTVGGVDRIRETEIRGGERVGMILQYGLAVVGSRRRIVHRRNGESELLRNLLRAAGSRRTLVVGRHGQCVGAIVVRGAEVLEPPGGRQDRIDLVLRACKGHRARAAAHDGRAAARNSERAMKNL